MASKKLLAPSLRIASQVRKAGHKLMASKKLLAPSLRKIADVPAITVDRNGQQEIAGPFVEEGMPRRALACRRHMASKKLLAPSLRKLM